MRIGVDATPLRERLTGVGNYLYYLLEELIQIRGEDRFFLYAINNSQRLHLLRKYPNVTIRIVPFLGRSEALWSQTTLAWNCRKDRVDLFWGSTQSIPLFGRGKMIITIYDFAYRLYPKTVSYVRGAYLRVFGKWLYKRADRHIAISQGTATRLDKLYGLRADRVVIPPIKNLQAEPVEEVLKRFSLKYRDYYIMVGTLEPRKNIVLALKAFDSTHPLVLVGGKGWRDSEILGETKRFSEKIKVLDYLPDITLNALVKGAKAYIMPSLYEGYGMPIAEARMLGTPVICCDVPEMIEAAEGNALVIPHEQLDLAFSSALPRFKKPTYPSNRELATRLSEAFSELLPENQDDD
ncbi:MAG: glycosyltransferase family 4 protein [Chlamydiales bacterium]|nr:glycosyltransferase family 4 protein [Chlamydiales bacterium]